jgi:benzil reductase ((S)-benzoin forming)
MQEHIRTADSRSFSDAQRFMGLKEEGQLVEPEQAADKIISWLQQPVQHQEDVVLRITDLP